MQKKKTPNAVVFHSNGNTMWYIGTVVPNRNRKSARNIQNKGTAKSQFGTIIPHMISKSKCSKCSK